jgi:hypothetical protein
MKKSVKLSKLAIHRETLRMLSAKDLQPAAGGYTGGDSHCTTLLNCPTGRTRCYHC